MGQTRHREGGESAAGPAGDSAYIPSFELIPLEDGSESDAALFDFGPDLDLPDGAPVAVLPPWMADGSDSSAAQDEELGPRRARRRAAQSVPRARRHRRPEEEPAVESTPAVPIPAQPQVQVRLSDDEVEAEGSLEDTRDVDVQAVIAAEVAAERTRRAQARSGAEVPSQSAKDRRVSSAPNPPVMIIESRTPVMPVPSVPAARPGQAKRPAPPSTPVKPGAAKSDNSGSRRSSWVAALLVAAALGGGLGAWSLSGGGLPSSGSTVSLAGSALQARDWVNVNLSEKSSVLAPASVAGGLRSVGFDSTRVISYPDGSSVSADKVPDWRCCNVFVAGAPVGTTVRDTIPSALRNSYDRSQMIAKFSAGGTVTEVRQVLDGTPAEVKDALKTEKDARKHAGEEIVTIDRITLSKAAEKELLAGRVDSRIMLALVGLSTAVEVSVESFPIDPADKAAGAPARSMRINYLERETIEAGSEAFGKAYDFLDVQVAPYRPMVVDLADAEAKDGPAILNVTYDAPGTLGLITPRED